MKGPDWTSPNRSRFDVLPQENIYDSGASKVAKRWRFDGINRTFGISAIEPNRLAGGVE
jgi:hypothetical protein